MAEEVFDMLYEVPSWQRWPARLEGTPANRSSSRRTRMRLRLSIAVIPLGWQSRNTIMTLVAVLMHASGVVQVDVERVGLDLAR